MVGAVPARAGARLARLQWWLRWWARTLGKAERYPKKLNASTDLAISHIWAKWKMSGNSCFFNSHKRTPANMILQHVSPERSDKFHIHTHFNSHVWASFEVFIASAVVGVARAHVGHARAHVLRIAQAKRAVHEQQRYVHRGRSDDCTSFHQA